MYMYLHGLKHVNILRIFCIFTGITVDKIVFTSNCLRKRVVEHFTRVFRHRPNASDIKQKEVI